MCARPATHHKQVCACSGDVRVGRHSWRLAGRRGAVRVIIEKEKAPLGEVHGFLV